MEKDLKIKFDLQTKDIYSAIGEFAVQFEHVCHYLKLIIMTKNKWGQSKIKTSVITAGKRV